MTVLPGAVDDAAASRGARPAPRAKAMARGAQNDKALSARERRAYLEALKAARAAHQQGDPAAALAGFDRALEVYPDDPRALSEKGWVEFLGGALDAAERDTRKALGRSVDVELLGSGYYNLGRIQEGRGNKDAALASYLSSLKVRPNETVKKRALELDPAAVGRGPVTPRLLAGPFKTLAAFCDAAKKEPSGPGMKVHCDPRGRSLGELEGSAEAKGPAPAPFKAVRLFASNPGTIDGGPSELGLVEYHLAFETAEGWYVLRAALRLYNPGAFGIFEQATIKAFEWRDLVPGGPGEFVARFEASRGDSDMGLNEFQSDDSELLVACGVGASGRPSCLELPVAGASKRELMNEDDELRPAGEPPIEHHLFSRSYALDVSFTP
ncbi:MAG TPA: tetratricopeptide repeat protein, partial [Polyangiaceae bacterium]|nr:tetratricopeptide repeat protein [Polyangiaceae bacterium]